MIRVHVTKNELEKALKGMKTLYEKGFHSSLAVFDLKSCGDMGVEGLIEFSEFYVLRVRKYGRILCVLNN